MNINEELKNKIIDFVKADYPIIGKHLSIKKCIQTITGNQESKIIIKGGKAYVIISDRELELIDIYCPDLKVPNASLLDEYATLTFANGKYLVEYYIDNDSMIGKISVYKEDENGYIIKGGKKYQFNTIIESQKIQEGISLDD